MANQKMLGFVHTAQKMPDKRSAADRRQDFAEIGRRAMSMLLALIGGEDADTSRAVPELIRRASTATAPR